MFHRITCPSCQHKFTVPEAAMGKLAHCPNCQSPFQAGKSVASEEPAAVPMKQQPAPATAGLNKTMLGETEPPIKFNCPRCKKALEAPAIEALTKKPCPACGQRLQVPAAPKAAAAQQPALNKTILATDESAAPATNVHPGYPAPAPMAQATTAPPPRETTSAAQAPAGPKGMYMLVTLAGGGIFLLALMVCGLTMIFSGGDKEKILKAQADFEKAKKDLEEFKAAIVAKELAMAQERQREKEYKDRWDKMMEEQRIRQERLDRQRDEDRNITDLKLAQELKEKRRREQDDLDQQAKQRIADREKTDQEMKFKLDQLKIQLDAANQKAQQATVIVSQPPPVYYPPYNPYRYWGW